MAQSSHRSSVLNRFRQHSRVRISAPFVCALSHYQSRRWLRRPGVDLGVVYDLSTRGARVSTQAEIKPGDEVTLSLRLPKQTDSPGKVRGCRFDDCRVGSGPLVATVDRSTSCVA